MSTGQSERGLNAEAKNALDTILRRIDFRADVFYRGQLCDSWALDTSGTGHVNFHLVCHGDCWLHMPGSAAATRLVGGDIVVFPRDAPHVIGSSPEPPPAYGLKNVTRQVPMGAMNPGTALICGFLEIDRTARQLLLSSLPEHLVIDGRSGSEGASASTLLNLLFSEASGDGLGVSAILDRLTDALLFYVVRDLALRELPTSGLLRAFCDPQVRRAVLAITADPGRRWTVDTLAQQALLSRSVFADRFIQSCGFAPIEFLTIWRMHLARRWLEGERASILEVSERCGYESPAAFSKAFKRTMGVGPGQFRRLGSVRSGPARKS